MDGQTEGEKLSKNWPVGDIVIAVLIIIFAILMFIGTQYFPHRARMGFITSARFTPILLSILITILCFVLINGTIKKYGKISIHDWFKETVADDKIKRSFVLIIMVGLYISLIGRVHFLFINTLYLFIIYWYLKIGTWKIIIIYSLAGGLITSWVVPFIFQMPLP